MEELKRETWEAPMTLGPWSVRSCRAGYLIEGKTGRVVRGSGGVASRADARIIAAAPEMRAFLENLVLDRSLAERFETELQVIIRKVKGEFTGPHSMKPAATRSNGKAWRCIFRP